MNEELTYQIQYMLEEHEEEATGFTDEYEASKDLMTVISDATTRHGMSDLNYETFINCLRVHCEVELNAITDARRMERAKDHRS